MQQVQITAQPMTTPHLSGVEIAPLTHDEAMQMSTEELRRFQALVGSLSDADWSQPTACDLWTVKDIVAHQAAHVRGFTSLGSFLGQLSPGLLRPYLKQGMSMLDAWNQSQVDLRRDATPAQLIAEINDHATASLRGRDRIPAFVRGITLPAPGLDQPRSMGYVFDLIYTRDMWMHRMDICVATGRDMPMDSDHDQRMISLIVRDLAEKAVKGLNGGAALINLPGPAGGRYRIGSDAQPQATLKLDVPSFGLLTSGREKAANLLTDSRLHISGDLAFGRIVLDFCENRVLY